jgi:CcmD family protein
MKSYEFLFWGYLVVWAGLATYLGVLGRRLSKVAKRLDSLETHEKGGGAGGAT